MALSDPIQKADLKALLDSKQGPTVDASGEASRLEFCEAMAEWLNDVLKAKMVVTTTVIVASVSGVTTGPSASGPGAGTGTNVVT